MIFKPVNRYLLIEPIEEQKREETGVLLPEEYSTQSIHGCCRILAIAPDCTREVRRGQLVVINNSMVETIKVMGETVHVLLENHVLGVIEEET